MRCRDHNANPFPLMCARSKGCDKTAPYHHRVEYMSAVVSRVGGYCFALPFARGKRGALRFSPKLQCLRQCHYLSPDSLRTYTRSSILIHHTLRRRVLRSSLSNCVAHCVYSSKVCAMESEICLGECCENMYGCVNRIEWSK